MSSQLTLTFQEKFTEDLLDGQGHFIIAQGSLEEGNLIHAKFDISTEFGLLGDEQTHEAQINRIKKLLKGEKVVQGVYYKNSNGLNIFYINFDKDSFQLCGGDDICNDTPFGSYTITCSYSHNKKAIDSFMKFLVKGYEKVNDILEEELLEHN